MKTRALKRFRDKLARGESVHGLWVTLESATVTELAVALGVDWVVIDAEHGHLDWQAINEHVRAGLRSDTVVLVRLAERSTSLTKRALDIGADGATPSRQLSVRAGPGLDSPSAIRPAHFSGWISRPIK